MARSNLESTHRALHAQKACAPVVQGASPLRPMCCALALAHGYAESIPPHTAMLPTTSERVPTTQQESKCSLAVHACACMFGGFISVCTRSLSQPISSSSVDLLGLWDGLTIQLNSLPQELTPGVSRLGRQRCMHHSGRSSDGFRLGRHACIDNISECRRVRRQPTCQVYHARTLRAIRVRQGNVCSTHHYLAGCESAANKPEVVGDGGGNAFAHNHTRPNVARFGVLGRRRLDPSEMCVTCSITDSEDLRV